MSTVDRICQERKCHRKFTAKVADVKRGWAKFCSKSCKAISQTRSFSRLDAAFERQVRK